MRHAYVTIRLKFNKDIDENELDDVVCNCNYEIEHDLIEDTEIIDVNEDY